MAEKATRLPASLSGNKLYKLLCDKANFFLDIGGMINRVVYDKELKGYNVVAFITSVENQQASIGRIVEISHEVPHKDLHIKLLERNTGAHHDCTYVLPRSCVKGILVASKSLWRLAVVTTFKGVERTSSILVDSDLDKLVKIQLDLVRAAKGLNSNFSYTLKRYPTHERTKRNTGRSGAT